MDNNLKYLRVEKLIQEVLITSKKMKLRILNYYFEYFLHRDEAECLLTMHIQHDPSTDSGRNIVLGDAEEGSHLVPTYVGQTKFRAGCL